MKLPVTLFSVLLLCSLQLKSQTRAIDSLRTAALTEKNDTTKVKVLLNLTLKLWEKAKYDSAYACSKTAYTIAEKAGYKKGMANALNMQANYQSVKSNYGESLKLNQTALKLRQEINDKAGMANSYNNIGYLYLYTGKYPEALQNQQEALKIRRELNDKTGISMSYLNLGNLSYSTAKYDEAINYFKEGLKIKEETGDKMGQATFLSSQGIVYTVLGNYTEALKCQIEALKIRAGNPDKMALAQSHLNIGTLYFYISDYEKAIDNYTKALKLTEEAGDKKGAADVYNNLGGVYIQLGNYPVALKNQFAALKIKKEINSKSTFNQTLNNIGNCYYLQGNIKDAAYYYNEALNVSKELGDKKAISAGLNNLGTILKDQLKYGEALSSYTTSLQFKKEIGDKNGEALTYINIGELLRLTNKNAAALEVFNKADTLAKKLGDKLIQSSAHMNIGLIKLKTNQISEARKHAAEALALAEEMGAIEYIKNALPILARVHIAEKNLAEAENVIRRASAIDNKLINDNFSILSESEKELYINALTKDYDLFNFFALQRINTNPAITAMIYDNALKNKGLLLRSSSAMRKAILGSGDSLLVSLYNEWISVKKKIVKTYSSGGETKVLEETANKLEKELVSRSQTFSAFDRSQNLTWNDVKNKLKPNEAAIEFVSFNTATSDSTKEIVYAALILKKQSPYPEMIKLFSAVELEKILGGEHQNNYSYVQGLYGKNAKPNTALYDLIWKPMEVKLAGTAKVYISPAGLLHKVAFAAMAKGPNVFLSDKTKLEIQTSTAKIVSPESFEFKTDTRVAVFGGINYETEKAPSDTNSFLTWTYLPGTKTEAEKIVSTLTKNKVQTTFLSGSKATENEFKKLAESDHILHLATHGFFFADRDEIPDTEEEKLALRAEVSANGMEYGFGVWSYVLNQNPLMRSGLALAGANSVWNAKEQIGTEDGVLTAMEVSNIDMRKAGLVVLSACETGLGDIKGSEGVYGLQRSFKMAGTKFIIMSLWQVPDQETEEFMDLLYTNLVTTKDLKRSFLATQTFMRKKYDPFYWAPFVLIE